MKLLLILIYSIMIQFNTVDADYITTFEWLTREEGLSNSSISSMFQDKYGFMWFGTQGGLNRYDGSKMIEFRSDPFDDNTIINNLIQTMYYDEANHEIWIGTYQGVSRFDIANNAFEHYTVDSHDIANPVITAIEKDGDGFIWLGSLGGLDRLNPETGELISYDIPSDVVRDILIASDNAIYIGTYDGLYRVTETLEKIDIELPSSYVMVVKEFHPNVLVLGMWDGGVLEYDMNQNITRTTSLKDNRVYAIERHTSGDLWIGTWGGGLFIKNMFGKIHHYPGNSKSKDISHSVVYSMHEDDAGIMWLGTNGGGINKWNPRKRDYVTLTHDPKNDNSLSEGKVNAIFQKDDVLYFGMYNGGINVYNESTETFTYYNTENSALETNTINGIIQYQDHLVIASNNGLYTLKDDRLEYWPVLEKDQIVYALEADEYNLWIGTYNDGLYMYNGQLMHIQKSNSDLSDDLIYDLHLDGQQLWIGTNDGLNVLNRDGSITAYQRKNDEVHYLSSNKIQVIYEDDSNNIWLGTIGGGVVFYNRETETYRTITENDGLSSNDVLGMLEDDDGHLWVATNNGISRIEMDTYDVIVYTPNDGIGGWEFSRGHLKSKSNEILFSGSHGITRIPGHLEEVSPVSPRVYISNISIIDRDMNDSWYIYNGQTIHVGASENYIGFDLSTIEYNNPDQITLRYRLLGIDDEWIRLGSNTRISYSKLPAGHYTLEVQVYSSDDLSSSVEKLHIHVAAHWYNQPYMYVLYALIIVSLIYLFVRFREYKAVKSKNNELAALNDQLEDMNNSLETLAIKDPLTGVFNRRYFNEMLQERLDTAKRTHTPLCLMMVDVDNFKDINDQYGHQMGDEVLILLSGQLEEALQRKTDFVSRFGGDEFAVVLYDTDEIGAVKIAKKLLACDKACFTFEEMTIAVSISIGFVAKIPEAVDQMEDLLKDADEQLYLAKSLGKNQISYKKYS